MENTKVTAKEMYNEIIAIAGEREDIVAFCENEIGKLERKAAKAKERAAEKKAESDALGDVVASILATQPQTRDEIFAQIEDTTGEITVAKVGARLTKLVNAGVAVKEPMKVEKRTVMSYRLA